MVVLCLIWSLQQIALKAVAPDVPPTFQIALRSGIAAVLVGALMLGRRERLMRDTLGPGGLVGILFAVEYLFVGEALQRTSAAHTVVLLYTAPIFAALGLHWRVPAERLGRVQWLGIALAFVGVAVTFLGPVEGGAGDAVAGAEGDLLASPLWGDLLALFGGVAWGATTVAIRSSRLAQAPSSQTLLYQLVGAALVLLLAAFVSGQMRFEPSPVALAGMAFQSVIVCFASFLAWFWLLRTYLASRLGVFSFLTPVFGVALGALLLDEALEARFVAGSALVVAGILIVSAHSWLSNRLVRKGGTKGGDRNPCADGLTATAAAQRPTGGG